MLNLATPLVLFDKSRLLLASGFIFTLPHLTFITHTLHHNTTLICTLILDILRYISSCNAACQIGAKIQNGSLSSLSAMKLGPNALNVQRVSIKSTKIMLKRRKESDTYLAADRRHRWSMQIAMKVDKVCSFQPALRPSSSSSADEGRSAG